MSDELLREIRDDVLEIKRWINGNNGDPGVKVRLDRLEQSAQARMWFTRTALGASLTAICGVVWSILTGK